MIEPGARPIVNGDETLTAFSLNSNDALYPLREDGSLDEERHEHMLRFIGENALAGVDVAHFSEGTLAVHPVTGQPVAPSERFEALMAEKGFEKLIVVPYETQDKTVEPRKDDHVHYVYYNKRAHDRLVRAEQVRLAGRNAVQLVMRLAGEEVAIEFVHFPDRVQLSPGPVRSPARAREKEAEARTARIEAAKALLGLVRSREHVLVMGDHNSIKEDSLQAEFLVGKDPLFGQWNVVRDIAHALPAVEPGEKKPDSFWMRKLARVGSLAQRLVGMAEIRGRDGTLRILREGGLEAAYDDNESTMYVPGSKFGVRVDHAEQRGLAILVKEVIDTIRSKVSDHKGLKVTFGVPQQQISQYKARIL